MCGLHDFLQPVCSRICVLSTDMIHSGSYKYAWILSCAELVSASGLEDWQRGAGDTKALVLLFWPCHLPHPYGPWRWSQYWCWRSCWHPWTAQVRKTPEEEKKKAKRVTFLRGLSAVEPLSYSLQSFLFVSWVVFLRQDFAMRPRLASDSRPSSWLCLPSARVTGVGHYASLRVLFGSVSGMTNFGPTGPTLPYWVLYS